MLEGITYFPELMELIGVTGVTKKAADTLDQYKERKRAVILRSFNENFLV